MSARKNLEHAERDAQIVKLRADDVPPREIAERFGISESRVCQIWRGALRNMPSQALDQRRVEADAFADEMIGKLLPILDDESVSARTKAEVSRVIATWEERRARLLGTDAPKRREVQVLTASMIDVAISQTQTHHGRTNHHQLLADLLDEEAS